MPHQPILAFWTGILSGGVLRAAAPANRAIANLNDAVDSVNMRGAASHLFNTT